MALAAIRHRFWHRRAQLLLAYGLIAFASGGLALIALYAGLMVLVYAAGW